MSHGGLFEMATFFSKIIKNIVGHLSERCSFIVNLRIFVRFINPGFWQTGIGSIYYHNVNFKTIKKLTIGDNIDKIIISERMC